jgi:DNA-binding CsgD family transcriptional regulator
MSSAGDPDIRISIPSSARLSAVPASRDRCHVRDPLVRIDAEDVGTLPRAGQPGHGWTASLRRQSVWMVDERQARYTGAFEVICCDCGDHPNLDYSEVSPRLQRIRGPYPLHAGVAAYAGHLGLFPGLHRLGWPGDGDAMTPPADPDTVTGPRPAGRLSAVPPPRSPHDSGDPWPRMDAEDAMALPVADQARLANERDSSAPGASALTSAELRLLPLLSTHLSFPEIAGEFSLSSNTIKSQAMSIYQKLGASSRSQAVVRSRELGLLDD